VLCKELRPKIAQGKNISIWQNRHPNLVHKDKITNANGQFGKKIVYVAI
jgi:hypothetical protein